MSDRPASCHATSTRDAGGRWLKGTLGSVVVTEAPPPCPADRRQFTGHLRTGLGDVHPHVQWAPGLVSQGKAYPGAVESDDPSLVLRGSARGPECGSALLHGHPARPVGCP